MADFYSPAFRRVTLKNGKTIQLRRGIHPLPDWFANSLEAHQYGIKPPSEMTDAEWASLGLQRPAPVAAPVEQPAVASAAIAPAVAAPSVTVAAATPITSTVSTTKASS